MADRRLVVSREGSQAQQELQANSEGKLTVASDAYSLSLRYAEDATYTYIGDALPGTAGSSPKWRIQRLTNATTTIEYAEGTSEFDKVWDNRELYNYS